MHLVCVQLFTARGLTFATSGIGAFATVKRKAREAASRETLPILTCSKVQPSNTNKLARFSGDRQSADDVEVGSSVDLAGFVDDISSAALLPTSFGRPHFAAAGGGAAAAGGGAAAAAGCLASIPVPKRNSYETVAGPLTLDGGAGAKRASAFAPSPPHGTSPPSSGGSSSPVAATLSKRANDDIAPKAAAGRALEKRTNVGGQHAQRERRNSD
jgi:hypothetical protein